MTLNVFGRLSAVRLSLVRLSLVLGLLAFMAPAARAEDAIQKPQATGTAVSYDSESSLRVLDGQGAVLASWRGQQPFRLESVFRDMEGDSYFRLERQAGTWEQVIDGAVQPGGLPGGTEHLVIGSDGALKNLVLAARDMVLRPSDLPAASAVTETTGDADIRSFSFVWPTMDGARIPVEVRVMPAGRGGEGDSAWLELRIEFEGRVAVQGETGHGDFGHGDSGGDLILAGRGRVVAGTTRPLIAALDLRASARMENQGQVLARAESSLALRLQDDGFRGALPAFGLAPITVPAEGRYARAGSSETSSPLWGFLLVGFGALGGAGYVLQGRRGRYRRLERLVVLALVPSLLLVAGPRSAEAGPVKDMLLGAAATVAGAAGALYGVGTVFAHILMPLGTALAGWGALSVGAAPFILGGALVVGGILLAAWGGKKLWRGFQAWRAQRTLTGQGTNPFDRARAAQRLGDYEDSSYVDVLTKTLDDASAEVRYAAAEALARIGDPAALSALATRLAAETDASVRLAIEKATLDLQRLTSAAGGAGSAGGGAGGGGGGAWGGSTAPAGTPTGVGTR